MSPVVGRMHVGHPRSWDWDQQKAEASVKSLATAPCPGQRYPTAGQKFLLASSLALMLQ